VVQPFFSGHAPQLARLGFKSGIPIISDYPTLPHAGALASLGVNGGGMRRPAPFDRSPHGTVPCFVAKLAG